MNYLVFFFLMNLLLFSRLKLIFRDDGSTRTDLLKMALLPFSGLLFLQINTGWFLLLGYLFLCPWVMHATEQTRRLNRNRILTLVMHLVIISLLSTLLTTNVVAGKLKHFWETFFLSGQEISSDGVLHFHILLFGIGLVINEMNIILRYFFRIFGLDPIGANPEDIDQQEYNTGRIIGMLERIFVFIFVLLNQYAAVGFILAAKGVTRFQDFKNRTFAEYVLIGTLFSTLLAMTTAFVIQLFL